MNRTKIEYKDLNARAQEDFNLAKVGALLADYGYTAMKLNNDWNGADFIAIREGCEAMHVQLKGRCMIQPKYQDKGLYICFPAAGDYYLMLHDELVEICRTRGYLNTKSWASGRWHVPTPPAEMMALLAEYKL